jgi:hypothetical protein
LAENVAKVKAPVRPHYGGGARMSDKASVLSRAS